MLMVNPIFSDGKEYISAIRAAEKIGYASDYIGQLCRAKKIPGELIGKSWYVDFPSLVEHKKNRKLGKPSPIIQDKLNQSTVFTYEKDDKSELPKLSKSSRYVEPVWTSVLFKQAVVSSLALLIAVSAGFATLEYATPSIAVEVRQKIENVQDGGKKIFLGRAPDKGGETPPPPSPPQEGGGRGGSRSNKAARLWFPKERTE